VVEEDDVVVVDDVVFAFDAGFAGFAGLDTTAVAEVVFVGDHFGADEAFLDVGVDGGGGFGGKGAAVDGPSSGLFFAGGVEGDEAEGGEGGFDEAGEAALLEAEGMEVFFGIGVGEAGELFFEAGADSDDGDAFLGGEGADSGNIFVFHGGEVFFGDVDAVEEGHLFLVWCRPFLRC
jgi:hypothetical protein